MRYESISDIYSANAKMRERFLGVLADVTPDEAVALPDGENWNIQQIVEHVGIVNDGMSRICAKLLVASAENAIASDGGFSLSEGFASGISMAGDRKVEAPERVQPKGDVSIETSLERFPEIDSRFTALMPDIERFDLTGQTFPHPFFGPLNAGEWMVMQGLHEGRHAEQIGRILEKIRK